MQLSPYRVLFLAANPSNTSRLRLDREVREVDESLRRSQYRDQFQLFQKQAVRMVDLRRALLDVKPHILHFSGHGMGEEGLILDDDQAGYVRVESTVLTNLIQLSPQVKCVVLNACHSYVQAMAIAHHIPYAIGMEREIGDEAAIQFATAFYDAIFAGEAIPKAYQYGIAMGKGTPAIYDARTVTLASETDEPPTATIPVLILGNVADPDQGQFRLSAPNVVDLGAIQFGPVGQHTMGQGMMHIQAQSLTGCVINNIVQVMSNPQSDVPQVATVGLRAQPRPLPVQLPPKAFPLLVGRQAEIEAAISTLPYRQPVEFYGLPGIGKTVLLRHLAHHPAIAPIFSGGLIYHRIRQYQSASDILQVLFNTFYETETPYKPTNAEIRQFLQHLDVLTLLDGSELSREQLDALISELPDFTFVVTASERQLWGEGRSVKLEGLTATNAAVLVSRELGRPLTLDEQQAVTQLCETLQGHPLRLLQAAALVQEEKKELMAIAQQFQTASSETAQYKQLVSSLQKPHLLILSLLAAIGGKAMAAEMIADITQLPDVRGYLDTLVRRHLVMVEGDASGPRNRYRLSKNFLAFLSGAAGVATWKLAVVDFFTRWVARQPDLPTLTDNAEVLYQAMQWAIEAEQWPQVIHLGKSLESTFAVNGQWDAWKHTLESLLHAAQMTGDPVVEAYALHQLGSRALGLNELTEAQDYLQRALEIRTGLGDRAGIEATQQNLDFLRPLFLPPSEPPSTPPSPPPARPRVRWPWILAGAGLMGALITTLIRPPLPPVAVQLTGFQLAPSTVQGNQTVAGQVELSGPTTTPITITLATTNADVVTMPSTLVVAAGKSEETFTLTTKAIPQETTVQITAAYGDQPMTQTLTIQPGEAPSIAIKEVNLDAEQVSGGSRLGGTVELMQPAPTDLTLALQSSDSKIAQVPETVAIAAGETVSSRFEIQTLAVREPTRLAIRAIHNGKPTERVLTVIPQSAAPISTRLDSLSFDPSSIEGGSSTTGTISLTATASEDVTVELESDDPGIAIPAQSTVTIPAGSTSTEFRMNTSEVGADTAVAIAATYQGQRISTRLVVKPVEQRTENPQQPCDTASPEGVANAIRISLPQTASGGEQINGNIRLNDCVPPSDGLTLTLSSDNSYLTQDLTSSVTLNANQTEQSFAFVVPDDLANYPDGGTVTIDFLFRDLSVQRRSVSISAPPIVTPDPLPSETFEESPIPPDQIIDYGRGIHDGGTSQQETPCAGSVG